MFNKIGRLLQGLVTLLAFTLLVLFGWERNELGYLQVNQENQPYLIRKANILPMDRDTLLVAHDLRISEGRIKEIGIALENKGEIEIDAKGKYLIPGLIDMHVHLWDPYELGLYLSQGVTSIRNLWGQPMHLRWKEEIDAGTLIGPRLFSASPKLSGPCYVSMDNKPVNNIAEAQKLLKRYKSSGYDFIKTYHGMSDSVFKAVVTEAQALDLDIVAHPSAEVAYADHFTTAVRSLEHAEEIVQQALSYQLDTLALDSIVSLYARHPNIALCPTLTVYHNIYRLIESERILENDSLKALNPMIRAIDSKAQYDRWQSTKKQDSEIGEKIRAQHKFQLRAVKLIHEAGGLIVCGTDAGIGITTAGYSIHQELAFYQEAGLSNFEVLQTATFNAAKVHEIMSDLGTIALNKKADLVLLDKDPRINLKNLQEPQLVFSAGKLLEANTLRELEEQALQDRLLVTSLLRYLENLLFERYR